MGRNERGHWFVLGTLLCPVHHTPRAWGVEPLGHRARVEHLLRGALSLLPGYPARVGTGECSRKGGVSAILSFLSSGSSACFLYF